MARTAIVAAATATVLGVLAASSVEASTAVPFQAALPSHLAVREGMLMVGAFTMPGLALRDLRTLQAETAEFAAGALIVCPRLGLSAEQAVAAGVGLVNATCPQGERFDVLHVWFGPDTDAVWNATLGVARMPQAAAVAMAEDGGLAILPSRDGVALSSDAGFRFHFPKERGELHFSDGGEERTFRGTAYDFLHEGQRVDVRSGAVAGWRAAGASFHFGPAPSAPLAEAWQPYALLDAQESLLGPEARETRANVTRLVQDYGRIPEAVNGGLVGALRGLADDRYLDGSPGLVKGDSFEMAVSGSGLRGTYYPTFLDSSVGIQLAGFSPQWLPWLLGGLAWLVASLVLVVRRASPARPGPLQTVAYLFVPLGAVVVDLAVLGRGLGTSGFGVAMAGGPAGAISSLATFAVVASTLAWLLVGLPGRVVVGRLVPPRWLLLADTAWLVVWLLALALAPAVVFALGHAAARL